MITLEELKAEIDALVQGHMVADDSWIIQVEPCTDFHEGVILKNALDLRAKLVTRGRGNGQGWEESDEFSDTIGYNSLSADSAASPSDVGETDEETIARLEAENAANEMEIAELQSQLDNCRDSLPPVVTDPPTPENPGNSGGGSPDG